MKASMRSVKSFTFSFSVGILSSSFLFKVMLVKQQDVHATKKSKFIVDSEEEENDMSDDELNADVGQNIGYDTVCAICDNGGEILPYVFVVQVHDHKDFYSFAFHPLCIAK